MTGLPKPTIARITNTLVSLGYLKQLPNSTKYTLDIGVLSLGYAALSNISIRNIAHQYMEEMSQYVQAPVAMATRDRLNMVYIDVVQIETALNMRRQLVRLYHCIAVLWDEHAWLRPLNVSATFYLMH